MSEQQNRTPNAREYQIPGYPELGTANLLQAAELAFGHRTDFQENRSFYTFDSNADTPMWLMVRAWFSSIEKPIPRIDERSLRAMYADLHKMPEFQFSGNLTAPEYSDRSYKITVARE